MHTEDIKFLMRKDKVSTNWFRNRDWNFPNKQVITFCFTQEKLKKLNQYLSFKESKQKLLKQVSQDDDEIIDSIGKIGLACFKIFVTFKTCGCGPNILNLSYLYSWE